MWISQPHVRWPVLPPFEVQTKKTQRDERTNRASRALRTHLAPQLRREPALRRRARLGLHGQLGLGALQLLLQKDRLRGNEAQGRRKKRSAGVSGEGKDECWTGNRSVIGGIIQ